MTVAKLAQYGFKAVTGIGRSLAKKQVAKLTPAQFCKVTKAVAKVQGNPFAEGIANEMFKNGKQYGKLANDMSKWAAREGQKVGLPQYMCQGGKVVQKGKFTPKGRKTLIDGLEKYGLPKNATVQDLLNATPLQIPGANLNVIY